MLVRVPPMSVEPSTSVTVPSALTLAAALLFSPMLNQKPLAIPRPRFLPTSGVCQWSLQLAASSVSMKPMLRIDRTVDAARAFLDRVLQAELDRIDLQLFGQLVDHRFAGKRRLRRARRRDRPRSWAC